MISLICEIKKKPGNINKLKQNKMVDARGKGEWSTGQYRWLQAIKLISCGDEKYSKESIVNILWW